MSSKSAGNDRAEFDRDTAEMIAAALLDKFGDQAVAVATRQAAMATQSLPAWLGVIDRLLHRSDRQA